MKIGGVIELDSATISPGGQLKIEKALKENSTLKDIWLPKSSVSDDVVNAICRFVQKNKTLIYLQLGKAHLSDGGLSRVLDSLSLNTTLVSIELWKCPITDVAVDAMCSFVQQNQTMTHLTLDRARFSDSGLSRILHALCSNSTLEVLSLRDSTLTDVVVDAMCSFLQDNMTMVGLNLKESLVTDGAMNDLCSFLQHNSTMAHLQFHRAVFTDSGLSRILQALSRNSSVRDLTIVDSPVTEGVIDGMCELIKTNESMTTFRLYTAGYQYTDSHLSTLMRTLGASSTLKTIRSAEEGKDPYVEVTMSGQEKPSYFYFINVNDTLQLLEQEEYLAQKAALEKKRRNEPLSDELKAVLDRDRVYLVDQIIPDSIYDHLRQDKSLTAEEEEVISFNKPRRQQVRLLLDLLQRKSRQDYENFKKALGETSQEYIQERLNKAEQDAGLH